MNTARIGFFVYSHKCRINLLYCVLFSGSEAKRNYIKSEPGSGALPGSGFFASQLGPSQNGPKSGLISVAITLHPTAAEVKGISLYYVHKVQQQLICFICSDSEGVTVQ